MSELLLGLVIGAVGGVLGTFIVAARLVEGPKDWALRPTEVAARVTIPEPRAATVEATASDTTRMAAPVAGNGGATIDDTRVHPERG